MDKETRDKLATNLVILEEFAERIRLKKLKNVIFRINLATTIIIIILFTIIARIIVSI